MSVHINTNDYKTTSVDIAPLAFETAMRKIISKVDQTEHEYFHSYCEQTRLLLLGSWKCLEIETRRILMCFLNVCSECSDLSNSIEHINLFLSGLKSAHYYSQRYGVPSL